MEDPVLVAGAGPTGLNMALWLHRMGAPFRIIDQHSGPGQASRALVVHARSLEYYDQLGLADGAIAAGTRVERGVVRGDGEAVAELSFEAFGRGLSPFPFLLDFPQDEHERYLLAALAARGIDVQWNTRLEDFEDAGDGVRCTLEGPSGRETFDASYLAGCDGAHSRVRERLGVGFAGGTYDHLFYVADASVSRAPDDALTIALGRGAFALLMPARKGLSQRLVGVVPDAAAREGSVSFEDVRESAEALLGVKAEQVHWFSTYRVHHRVASHFRAGRVFLSGDAAHLHSPAGGQGMNTGIGDAVNLAWKLGTVVTGRADAAILDSYEPERIGFARQLVRTTDRVFQAVVAGGPTGGIIRKLVMPYLLPAATRFGAGRALFFRILSQTRIAYPDSLLSEGKAGGIEGGDRLPWVEPADNHAVLRHPGWQVQLSGCPPEGFREAVTAMGLPLNAFPFSPLAEDAGFAENAAYLVRPDGHVALASPAPDAEAIRLYARQRGLVFSAV